MNKDLQPTVRPELELPPVSDLDAIGFALFCVRRKRLDDLRLLEDVIAGESAASREGVERRIHRAEAAIRFLGIRYFGDGPL